MTRLKGLSEAVNVLTILAGAGLTLAAGTAWANNGYLSDDQNRMVTENAPVTEPFGVGGLGVAPLVMMTVGREHGLFSEAYTDYTDVDGDGNLDIMYDPSIEYYGLYDSDLCYKYQDGAQGLQDAPSGDFGYWYPQSKAKEKSGALAMWNGETRSVRICEKKNQWSGNFLNYLTSSRIDIIKRVLYGGTRVYNTHDSGKLRKNDYKTTRYVTDEETKSGSALLAHSRVLRDAHAWGKVLGDKMYGGAFTVSDFTGLDDTGAGADTAWFFVVASPDNPGNRWTSSFMRYGKVENAAMPGVASDRNDLNYIWDWASRESNNYEADNSIASKNQHRVNRKSQSADDHVTKEPLFVGGARGVTETTVAVVTCTKKFHDPESCKNYGTEDAPIWQPIGLLQQYGEGTAPRMKFGLLTGSWQNNRRGGALRANVGDFSKEIFIEKEGKHKPGDFDFTLSQGVAAGKKGDKDRVKCDDGDLCGVVATFDRFGIVAKNDGGLTNYGMGAKSNGDTCERATHVLGDMAVEKGNPLCADWGNPVGELLYQTARYFRGMSIQNAGTAMDGRALNIGHVEAKDPYPDGSSSYCAKPVSLVLADENISFDSPESNSDAYGGDAGAIVAETRSVSAEYGLKRGSYYMGGVVGKDSGQYEFVPSRKEISDLSQVVGIAPGAAFSFGSYNVAGVASLYSKALRTTKGPNGSASNQYLSTYVVAMQPNMPQINLSIGGAEVEILPFGKTPTDIEDIGGLSPGTTGGHRVVKLENVKRKTRIHQSTNQAADFYVLNLGNNEGEFMINYEDFEYGSDYDMDWVVNYKYQVLQGASGDWYVRIQLSHNDGDPYSPQHAGYVITGVEHEGVYMDLGKYSAGNYGDRVSNIYELDNVVSDASLIKCTQEGKSSLANVVTKKVSDNALKQMACLVPAEAYTEDDYVRHFWSAGQIDDYYKNHILPNADFYYANRKELYNEGYKMFASWEEVRVNGHNTNFRLLGDKYSSAGQRGGLTSSRVFKVRTGSTDSGWLKTPLWFAAKYGLNSANSLARSNPQVEPDNYYLVTNPIKLKDGLAQMLNKIDQSFKTGSSFVAEGNTLTAGGFAYGSNYDPATWYGSLEKIKYDADYHYTQTYAWNAAEAFASVSPEDRLIMTMDYAANKLVRLYAEDIGYDHNDYKGYASSSASSGVAAYAGYNIVRALMNDDSLEDDAIREDDDILAYADKMVRWMLGEHKYEGLNSPEFDSLRLEKNGSAPLRYRAESLGAKDPLRFVLGDIINSDAAVFAPGNDGKQFIAVGANDGMLHILDEADGKPVVSYVPSVMLSSLGRLVRETYATDHYPFVDSTPVFFRDRQSDGKGKSYLYGTYGLGFKGGYVLNVTGLSGLVGKSPDEKFKALNESAENPLLLWELTEKRTVTDGAGTQTVMGSDFIGKQRLAPTMIRHPREYGSNYPAVPYLLYGSGYDATRQGLLLVDMLYKDNRCLSGSQATFTPCVVSEIETPAEDPWGNGRTNALAPVATYSETVVDEFADQMQGFIYRALYWGDTFGNVWKVDLSVLDANEDGEYYDVKNWGVAGDSAPQIIFSATDANGVAQPITARIGIGFNNAGGIGLLFGTGSMWTEADYDQASRLYNVNQSLYMIRDFNTTDPEVNAGPGGKLVHRCAAPSMVASSANRCLVPLTEAIESADPKNFKMTAQVDPSVDLTNAKQFGWYLDVYSPEGGTLMTQNSGARLYRDVNIVDGTWFSVPVNIPNVGNACGGGGTSYVLSGYWVFRNNQVDLESDSMNDFLLGEGKTYVDAEGNLRTEYGGDKATAAGPSSQDETTHITKALKSSSWQHLF